MVPDEEFGNILWGLFAERASFLQILIQTAFIYYFFYFSRNKIKFKYATLEPADLRKLSLAPPFAFTLHSFEWEE